MTIQTVIKSIEEFQELQEKYSEFGANNMEPNTMFRYIVRLALDGDGKRIKSMNNFNWELYSNLEGWEEAAGRLSMKCIEVIDFIHKCEVGQLEELRMAVGKII